MPKKKSYKIQKKSKPNFINGLKELTNWIIFPNQKIEKLEYILETYNMNEYIIKRLYSYIYSYPHIIHYCNEYMNNKFIFSTLFSSKLKKKENLSKFIFSFAYILYLNNCNNKRNFVFIKGDAQQDKNRDQIKKLLNDYFIMINGKKYNKSELNFFYDLFTVGKITDIELMKIDQIINNGKSTIKIENYIPQKIKSKTKTGTIINRNTYFDNDLINFKNKSCDSCPLFKNNILDFNSNVTAKKEIDVAFFGLNDNEINSQLQDKLNLLNNQEIEYILVNLIQCNSNNKQLNFTDIFNQHCQHMFKYICDSFPAKYYVFIGKDASKIIGINGKIQDISGKLFKKQLMPLIHPNNLKSKNLLDLWENSFKNIFNLFNIEPVNIKPIVNNYKQEQVNNIDCKYNIPQENIITSINSNLTFFDVKEVDKDTIVEIYIDQNGIKKYLFKDFLIEVNIKRSQFIDCKMIEDSVTEKVNIKGSNKYYISKLLNDQLINFTNS